MCQPFHGENTANDENIQSTDNQENEIETDDDPSTDSENNITLAFKKKRFRRSYNCGPCKRHKIKCDKKCPCGNCKKYKRVNQCKLTPPTPPTEAQFKVKQERKIKYLNKKNKKNNNEKALNSFELTESQIYYKASQIVKPQEFLFPKFNENNDINSIKVVDSNSNTNTNFSLINTVDYTDSSNNQLNSLNSLSSPLLISSNAFNTNYQNQPSGSIPIPLYPAIQLQNYQQSQQFKQIFGVNSTNNLYPYYSNYEYPLLINNNDQQEFRFLANHSTPQSHFPMPVLPYGNNLQTRYMNSSYPNSAIGLVKTNQYSNHQIYPYQYLQQYQQQVIQPPPPAFPPHTSPLPISLETTQQFDKSIKLTPINLPLPISSPITKSPIPTNACTPMTTNSKRPNNPITNSKNHHNNFIPYNLNMGLNGIDSQKKS